MDEERLIRGLRRREPEALEALVRQYTAYGAAVAGRILRGRPQDVEEVLSDAFLAVWNSADKLRAYLGRVVRNRALNRLRDLGEEPPLEGDVFSVLPAAGDGPQVALERRERSALVRETLDALPPEDREIFLRHYYDCQTVAEIGAAMGMKPATVKTRLYRGRGKLKGQLEKRGFHCETEDF